MAIEQLMQAILTASPQQRRRVEAVLKGKDPDKKSALKETRLVTISGAAKLLALGRNTVYGLIRSGRLETVKLGVRPRVTLASIHAFLEGGKEDVYAK